jgi:hypothetical protein
MTSMPAGFVLLIGGAVALALVTFSAREMRAAFGHAFVRPLSAEAGRRARVFWEAMARNLILLGALAAPFGFVAALSHGDEFPPIVQLMGEQVFGPLVAALALAILCALPASRALGSAGENGAPPAREGKPEDPRGRGWLRVETGLGYVLLTAVLVRAVLTTGEGPNFRPIDWLLHAPAWLAVGAGALAFVVYRGEIGAAASVTHGLAGAGAMGALFGLLNALHGFAGSRIEAVAGGLVFVSSACVATLVGLAAVGLPREDRALGKAPGAPSRLVWYGFPLLTVLMVLIAWLMVSTPMKMRT